MIFDLSNTLASNTVFLTYGIKCATFALARKAKSIRQYATRALGKALLYGLKYVEPNVLR